MDQFDEFQVTDTSFLDYCHEFIAELYKIWLTWGEEGKLPGRKDFDPIDLAKYLRNVSLVDVDHENQDFRYRLLGTAAVEFRKWDPTGKSVKEGFIGETYHRSWNNYSFVVESKSFLYDCATVPAPSGFLVSDEALFLPLSNDGDTVDMIFVFSTYWNLRSQKNSSPP